MTMKTKGTNIMKGMDIEIKGNSTLIMKMMKVVKVKVFKLSEEEVDLVVEDSEEEAIKEVVIIIRRI